MGALHEILRDVPIPKMARVQQHFNATQLENVRETLWQALSAEPISRTILPGQTIAITAGSRGIDQIPLLLQTIVEFVRSKGAIPFLVPAMGSHGGASAEGQVEILHSYGITEEQIGAPIRATMEVKEVCRLADGMPVYLDAYAYAADGIIVVNRTKFHTLFHGTYESGLMKMIAVGLGKQRGAETIHSRGPASISETVRQVGTAVLHRCNVLFGVTVVENAFERICELCVLLPEEIPEKEPALLLRSKQHMPQIHFENLDLLVVDRIGKNISGSGMDPNITHTFTKESGISTAGKARRICVLDLTDETHGSALGVGMADTTTKRLADKFSFEGTYANALTTSVLESAKIPAVFENQKLAIQAAIQTIPDVDCEHLRMVRIRDTLHLEEIQISEGLAAELHAGSNVELLEAFCPLVFNSNGDLF